MSWRLLAIAAALALAAPLARAAPARHRPPPAAVVVIGHATVRAAPDRALVTLAIETRDAKPQAAQRENAKRAAALDAALTAAGIPEKARRTIAYDLREEFDYRDGKRVSRGFLARSALEVRVDDVSRLGEIIDRATAAGATGVAGIRFDVRDRGALERDALQRATQDARARAEAVARGAGVHVGRLLRIEERPAEIPAPVPRVLRARAAAAETAPSTSIAPGEIEVRASVTLRAEIAP